MRCSIKVHLPRTNIRHRQWRRDRCHHPPSPRGATLGRHRSTTQVAPRPWPSWGIAVLSMESTWPLLAVSCPGASSNCPATCPAMATEGRPIPSPRATDGIPTPPVPPHGKAEAHRKLAPARQALEASTSFWRRGLKILNGGGGALRTQCRRPSYPRATIPQFRTPPHPFRFIHSGTRTRVLRTVFWSCFEIILIAKYLRFTPEFMQGCSRPSNAVCAYTATPSLGP